MDFEETRDNRDKTQDTDGLEEGHGRYDQRISRAQHFGTDSHSRNAAQERTDSQIHPQAWVERSSVNSNEQQEELLRLMESASNDVYPHERQDVMLEENRLFDVDPRDFSVSSSTVSDSQYREMLSRTESLYSKNSYDDNDDDEYEDGFVELISKENADKLRSIIDTLRENMQKNFSIFSTSRFHKIQTEWMQQQHADFQKKVQVKYGAVDLPEESLQGELSESVALELQEKLEVDLNEETEEERRRRLREQDRLEKYAKDLKREEAERKKHEDRLRESQAKSNLL